MYKKFFSYLEEISDFLYIYVRELMYIWPPPQDNIIMIIHNMLYIHTPITLLLMVIKPYKVLISSIR